MKACISALILARPLDGVEVKGNYVYQVGVGDCLIMYL